MLVRREYGGMGNDRSPLEPVMFSRTDAFTFRDAPKKHLCIETAPIGERGIKLSRVTSSGHEVSLTERDHFTLLLPTHGSLDVAAGKREYHARPGQLMAFRPNSRRTRVSRAPKHDYIALVLMIPMYMVNTDTAETPLRVSVDAIGDGVLLGASDIVSSLRSYLDFLIDDYSRDIPVLRSPEAHKAVETLAMEQFREFLNVYSENQPSAASIPMSKVREAEEFMLANYAEPLSIADVARAVEVGTRSLQDAYRKTLGTTPKASLTAIRLEEARKLICHGKEGWSITQIALACGFTHLGRFSQIYREAFGELPSETLRKHSHIYPSLLKIS